MTPVFVDTSVWIDFFNGRVTAETTRLRQLLGQQPLAIGDLVLMEVLQGFRREADVRRAERLLAPVECHVLEVSRSPGIRRTTIDACVGSGSRRAPVSTS